MKIALIIPSLRSGGAERVLSTLANYWYACGHNVHLITLENSNTDFYEINPGIHRHALGLAKESRGLWDGLLANIARARAIRRLCLKHKPDVALSFLDATNILVSIALYKSGIPLIVSERTDPTQRHIGVIRTAIRPFLYQYACDAIVVQTNNVLKKVSVLWKNAKIVAIPNPLPEISRFIVNRENHDQALLSVGRLNSGKGIDILINAFARILPDYPRWTLRIVGEGPLYESLQEQIKSLGLAGKAILCGSKKHVFDEYKNSDIFCLVSRYEGFPNALLEALAMGCACISTDCESGPREILEDGRLGVLIPVDDVDALTDGLRCLMQSSELRVKYSSHAAYVRERYHLDKISQQWLNLFKLVQK